MGGPFFGLDLASVIGANRFYNNGYTGTRSIISNVEGGLTWNGHETLTNVNTFMYSNHPSLIGTQIGQYDRHATWVGQTMVGQGPFMYQRGIAYNATLWSGGIATAYGSPPYSTQWGWANGFAFTAPYATSFLTGVNGKTADVINSSWGTGSSNNYNVFAVSLDAMVRQSGKVFVAAAGNSGPGSNTIGSPANGLNGISVGALGPDTDGYNHITSFSSRGPADYSGPDGTFLASRARVDITAPGDSLTLAFYGGATGGNTGGSDPSGGSNSWYSFGAAGTSFAAPMVAAGAALLVDAGKDRYAGGESIDSRVIKSVIQTSAAKSDGWSNGQALNGSGTIVTSQALDFTYGAGRMDLSRAYDVFLASAGTHNVLGDGGGNIAAIGWDSGVVNMGGQNDYAFNDSLLGGSTITATLNWFANATYSGNDIGGAILTTADSFSNLELQLLSTDGTFSQPIIADSNSTFLTTQHFSIVVPQTGHYALRVKWLGQRYNFVGTTSERYGLAWTASAVPEPATMAALGLGVVGLMRRRTNRR